MAILIPIGWAVAALIGTTVATAATVAVICSPSDK